MVIPNRLRSVDLFLSRDFYLSRANSLQHTEAILRIEDTEILSATMDAFASATKHITGHIEVANLR